MGPGSMSLCPTESPVKDHSRGAAHQSAGRQSGHVAFMDPYPEFRCLMPPTSEFLWSQKGRALTPPFRGKRKLMLCDLSLITRGTCRAKKPSRSRSPKCKMKTVLVMLLAGLRVLM